MIPIYITIVWLFILQSLLSLYDGILLRADQCYKMMSQSGPDMSKSFLKSKSNLIPSPEPLLYNAALRCSREAAVDELLGNLDK